MLLQTLITELTSKRLQAELLLEFLQHRKGRSARVRFTQRDFEIAAAIRELNRPTLRAAETKTPNTAENAVMIESDLHGDMQSVAEMPTPVTGRIN